MITMKTNYSPEESSPPTYIVLQFSKRVKKVTANWLINKIKMDIIRGGAELTVKAQPFVPGQRLTFHVTTDSTKLLRLAEALEIKKIDLNGVLREISLNNLHEFTDSSEDSELLTLAEKQLIICHELENIRALPHEKSVPGYSYISLYEGQSILLACASHGLVKQMFPLHDVDELKKMGPSWYLSFSQQPFEWIRLYFGESIALYFHFLGFYTKYLLVPTALGLAQVFYPSAHAVFAIFNVICAAIFLELWGRRCSELAFSWGTILMAGSTDEPRAKFRGVMKTDPVTGKLVPSYPRWKTYFKMYCVSLPVVTLCLVGAFAIMMVSFVIEDRVKLTTDNIYIISIPSVIYAIVIYFINLAYRKFATFLTEWENHRTQSQFDRHRVTKLVLFEFVNNFMSLFYIAFYIQDVDMLRSQLATLLIMLQVINNIQEAVLPLVFRKYYTKVAGANAVKKSKKRETIAFTSEDFPGVEMLDESESVVDQALSESTMDVYEDPYDDYLELFVQFGYVLLFSAVYPMAGFWAVVNNLFEIRTDGFKLCSVYQRPLPRRVKDTGAWQRWFQLLCSVSVMTNCGLVYLMGVTDAGPDSHWLLMCVALEHALLAAKLVIHYAVPARPHWVRQALASATKRSHLYTKQPRGFGISEEQQLLKEDLYS